MTAALRRATYFWYYSTALRGTSTLCHGLVPPLWGTGSLRGEEVSIRWEVTMNLHLDVWSDFV